MSIMQVCYVYCNLCNTILTVNVPSNITVTVVKVTCGNCTNLLSVNMSSLIQSPTLIDRQLNKSLTIKQIEFGEQQRILPPRPPEKRQRVPSAYNMFIKEEIQRIKAKNPKIRHREAFSTAAKNLKTALGEEVR